MSQPTTSSAIRRFRYIEILCAIWIAIGAIVTLYILFPLNIFSPSWGVPLGPERLGIYVIIGLTFFTPFGVLVIADQLRRPDWLAPRGRYVEGRHYPAFPPRRYIEIAFVAALVLAFNNIALPFVGVSLVCIGLIFGATFFGPLTIFISVFVAHTFGVLLGLPSEASLGPIGSLGTMLTDAPIYAFAGWFFFKYVMSPSRTYTARRRLATYVPWIVAWNLMHLLFWSGIAIPVWTGPAWWGFLLTYIPTNYPTNVISGLIGVAAAEAAIRGLRRTAPMGPAPPTGSSTGLGSPAV